MPDPHLSAVFIMSRQTPHPPTPMHLFLYVAYSLICSYNDQRGEHREMMCMKCTTETGKMRRLSLRVGYSPETMHTSVIQQLFNVSKL